MSAARRGQRPRLQRRPACLWLACIPLFLVLRSLRAGYEFLRAPLCPVRDRRPDPGKARAADGGHGPRGRGEEGARRLHADRPPRQDRLSGKGRRVAPRRAADDRGRDLSHLFDDQAHRFGRGDDAGRGGAARDHGSRLEIPPRVREPECRRRKRRPSRPCAAQAADHGPGPHAAYVWAHLRLYGSLASPEARQGRRRFELEPDVGRKRRLDRDASAHASAGRGLGVRRIDRRARSHCRDRRRRPSRRGLAGARARSARHGRHRLLHAGTETGAARRSVLVRLHGRGGRRLGQRDGAAQIRSRRRRPHVDARRLHALRAPC